MMITVCEFGALGKTIGCQTHDVDIFVYFNFKIGLLFNTRMVTCLFLTYFGKPMEVVSAEKYACEMGVDSVLYRIPCKKYMHLTVTSQQVSICHQFLKVDQLDLSCKNHHPKQRFLHQLAYASHHAKGISMIRWSVLHVTSFTIANNFIEC